MKANQIVSGDARRADADDLFEMENLFPSTAGCR